MVEKEQKDKEKYENFLSPKELENYNATNRECTLFITKNSKRSLW